MPAEVKPANPSPCSECPWRLINQGRKDDLHKFYSRGNLKRLWIGLRRGARMSCHPTDSRMAEFEGYEDLEDREITHECAGALTLQQREFMTFQQMMQASPEAKRGVIFMMYRKRRPNGMTLEGLRAVVERAVFGGAFSGVEMRSLELDNAEIGYPQIGGPCDTSQG